jgi:hypothetical protein
MAGVIHIALRATGIHPHSAVGGIDSDALHRRKVNHQSLITNSQPGTVVTSTADGDRKAILAGKIHRCHCVRHVRATNDNDETPIDHRIVHFASAFIFTAGGGNQLPRIFSLSLLNCSFSIRLSNLWFEGRNDLLRINF